MKLQFKHLAIVLIIVLGLAVRAIPLLQTQSLTGADGYFHLVLVKEIIKTGFIQFWNPLSQGGKEIKYPPGFHAIATALIELTNIDPEILAMFFSLPFYFIILAYCYKKGGIVGLAAIVFSPVFVWKTLTNFLVDPLWAFLLAISFEANIVSFFALFALSCTHSIAIILIPFLVIFKRKDYVKYLAAFLIIAFWLVGGSRDVPTDLQPFLFEGLDPVELVKRMGVPLLGLASPIAGPWAILLGALVFLKLFELDRAIMAVVLLANRYPKHTIVLLLVITQPLLAIYMMKFVEWSYPTNYLEPMKWIGENRVSTIAGPYWLGYWILGIAGKKNILDGNWESPNNQERYDDLQTILYSEKEEVDPILSKYNSTTIIGREKGGYEKIFNSNSTTIWS
jgi:putative Ca2+/H+ antiporter (TMEM165/GDT1 family)